MIKTASLLALIITALASMPAHAQQVRGFVSGEGLDTNPCTLPQPCRTFQQAFNTIPANGVIWVLDPAGYGPLTITHGVSVQGRGMGAITQTCNSCNAITISVTTGDPVTLDGLILDGTGTGDSGIYVSSGPSVQIFHSIVRHFQYGIYLNNFTSGADLLVEDTVVSDNSTRGIYTAIGSATLNRITANNNPEGVTTGGASTTVANSVLSNNGTGLNAPFGLTFLGKNVISGNGVGVVVGASGTANSYGDNYIRDNGTSVTGSLTPVGMQ